MCKERNIECVISKAESDFYKEWDLVFIPSTYIPPSRFPNTKRILYGPQEFIFVNGLWKRGQSIFPPHCFYNLLSKWVVELQEEFGGLTLPSKCLPFAVDIERFQPSPLPKPDDCLIYFKRRKLEDLDYVLKLVKEKNLKYHILKYGSYHEDEFIEKLKKVKFCVWIGCHESQGFAVQEALSCNVPLLVLNSTSMFDEQNNNNEIAYTNEIGKYALKATSVPYWDNRCGIVITKKEEMSSAIDQMTREYSTFKPRSYIEETLSPKACIDRLLYELEL